MCWPPWSCSLSLLGPRHPCEPSPRGRASQAGQLLPQVGSPSCSPAWETPGLGNPNAGGPLVISSLPDLSLGAGGIGWDRLGRGAGQGRKGGSWGREEGGAGGRREWKPNQQNHPTATSMSPAPREWAIIFLPLINTASPCVWQVGVGGGQTSLPKGAGSSAHKSPAPTEPRK